MPLSGSEEALQASFGAMPNVSKDRPCQPPATGSAMTSECVPRPVVIRVGALQIM